MKIDIFSHILPEKYLAALKKKVKKNSNFREMQNRANCDLELRLRLMDRNPDVLQVLVVSLPSLEAAVSVEDAIELSRIANDELAELVAEYPDKFAGAVAVLPLNDIDESMKEAERAITELGLKGVQIFTTINEESLDQAKFRPLYEKMAHYDLPLWIHPISTSKLNEPLFGWPYETASAMRCLVSSGVFNDYPEIKFITHHCGSMVPSFAGRINWMFRPDQAGGIRIKDPVEHFQKFYNDTALYGNAAGLMCGYEFFGPEHLLFGTDAPLGPDYGLTAETAYAIEEMGISESDKEKIFWRNAVKLLKIAT